ncbi:MAG: hypothetical protein ACPLW8_01170 [Candidatus Bathyarchaeales archaeon]
MKTVLKIKCKFCGAWNRIEVEKVLFEPESREPKVKIFVPMYLPYKVETCKKCKKVIAEPKELIRILKTSSESSRL